MSADFSMEKDPKIGILISLLAYLFITFIGIFQKLMSHTVTVPVILFFQSGICFLCLIPSLWKSGLNELKTEDWNTYFIRIASGLGCYAALFYLIRYIPISEALLYQYSASLWIPFITFFWLDVRMARNLWWGILVGFAGIIFILNPVAMKIGTIAFVGIICGILQGISVVAIRKLSVTEPIARVLFYYFLTGVLITTPYIATHWSPLTGKDIALLLGLGFSTYIAQKLFAISCQYASATTLAPTCYASILFSGLFAWFFWHEVPSHMAMVGMALVIGGCVLSIWLTPPTAKEAEVVELELIEDEPSVPAT